MSEHPNPYSTYFAGEKLEQEASSVLIAYRLTLAGAPRVESTPWHRDSSMNPYSVRVMIGDEEITLTVADWGDRLDEVRPYLREWIRKRVHLEQATLKSGSRRRDPYWADQWRRARPWGVTGGRAAKLRFGTREEPRHGWGEPASGALIGRRMGPVPPGRRAESLRSAETRDRGVLTRSRIPCTRGSGQRDTFAGRERHARR